MLPLYPLFPCRQAASAHRGFSRRVPDVLRHTFAGYHAAWFRDLSLLRTRYISPIPPEKQRDFGKATSVFQQIRGRFTPCAAVHSAAMRQTA